MIVVLRADRDVNLEEAVRFSQEANTQLQKETVEEWARNAMMSLMLANPDRMRGEIAMANRADETARVVQRLITHARRIAKEFEGGTL